VSLESPVGRVTFVGGGMATCLANLYTHRFKPKVCVMSPVGEVNKAGLEWQFMWGRVPALSLAIKLPRFLPSCLLSRRLTGFLSIEKEGRLGAQSLLMFGRIIPKGNSLLPSKT